MRNAFMRRTKTWVGVRGKYYIECWRYWGGVIDAHTQKFIPVDNELFQDTAEITIHFESTGSFDPGCMWMPNGDPGYPPEGDEERTFVAAFIREHGSKDEVRLSDDVGNRLFEMYEEKINDVELDYTQDDE